MPPTKKPAGAAVDRRNGRRAELGGGSAEPIEVQLPRPREEYQSLALTAWDGYWTTEIATTVTEADLMIAHTWIEAYNAALALRAKADADPIVPGSMGQPTANPLFAVAHQSMTLAMSCARQLGIGARNRADLGIALVTGNDMLNQWNSGLDVEDDEDDGDDDPRLIRPEQ